MNEKVTVERILELGNGQLFSEITRFSSLSKVGLFILIIREIKARQRENYYDRVR